MTKLQDGIKGTRNFFHEVMEEAHKAVWPDRHELMESTLVVIVTILLMAAFIGLSDAVLIRLLKLIAL